MTDLPCFPGMWLCKPQRRPTPSGRIKWFHASNCPDKPGVEIHMAKENAQGRTFAHGFKGRRR